jgi:hypothetical protein
MSVIIRCPMCMLVLDALFLWLDNIPNIPELAHWKDQPTARITLAHLGKRICVPRRHSAPRGGG